MVSDRESDAPHVPLDGTASAPAGIRRQQAQSLSRQIALPEGEHISVMLAVRDPEIVRWIHDSLREQPLVHIIGEAHDGIEAAHMARELRPAACIIEAELPVVDGYETCELLSMVAPEVATVLVHDEEWVGGDQAAMRLGARACVAAKTNPLPLLEILTKLTVLAKRRKSPQFQRLTDPAHLPNVIVVSSAKGGVGKTTVSVNVAVALARRYPDETVLVDYYSHYGDAALMLGLRSSPNICELARENSEMRLPAYLQMHESTLRVLAGASAPEGTDDPLASVEFAGRLLTALRTQFQYIVFDLPPVLSAANLHLLARCNHFLAIANFHELTTLRDTMLLMDGIRGQSISTQRVKLVGNRVDSSNRHLIKDLERLVDHPVTIQLPDDNLLLMDAINSGVPFVLSQPRAALSRGILSLVDQVDMQKQAANAEAAREGGAHQPLLSRWFGGGKRAPASEA